MGFIVTQLLLGFGQHGLFKAPSVGGQGAEHLAQRLHKELRALTKMLEGLCQSGHIDRCQFGSLAHDEFSDVGHEFGTQFGQSLNL